MRVNRVLMWKSLAVSAAMIVFFFAGWPVPKVALVAGALLLVTRRVKPEKVYREIDWSLLVLFIGLFIVVAGVEKTSLHGGPVRRRVAVSAWSGRRVHERLCRAALEPGEQRPGGAGVQAASCRTCPIRAHAWLTLAMSSTLAGNLTILGSVANLIVVERARREVRIGFGAYARAGIPLTVITIAMGVLLLNG